MGDHEFLTELKDLYSLLRNDALTLATTCTFWEICMVEKSPKIEYGKQKLS